jgi:ATP-binding cassette, subfamily C, bacterial
MNGGCVQAFGAAEQILSQVTGLRPASSLASATGPDGAVNRRLPDRQRAARG